MVLLVNVSPLVETQIGFPFPSDKMREAQRKSNHRLAWHAQGEERPLSDYWG